MILNGFHESIIAYSDNKVHYSLASADKCWHNPLTVATPAVEIDLSFINKRTSAHQRYFYARVLSLLWQRAWENRKVRRFLLSGKVNPAYAVALLLDLNGDSQSLYQQGDCYV